MVTSPTHQFLIDGEHIGMSPTEFFIWVDLFNARGREISIKKLLDTAFGHRSVEELPDNLKNVVHVHICHLRRKLHRTRFCIVSRFGYYHLKRLPIRSRIDAADARGVPIAPSPEQRPRSCPPIRPQHDPAATMSASAKPVARLE